jgi:pilus assembly protein CpaF
LLEILGTAELKLFCVGPTGSGKTTLLNIIANTIPHDKRIILVQNPTEISFMERDVNGRNIRNVVHWEVVNAVAMEALISNTLRATPEVILIGEAREGAEFFQIQRAMRTGHKVLGTFHAEDATDGVGRFATELSSIGGTSYMESVRLVADTIDIIISQFKFPDGRRRIMEISEIDGVDEKGDVRVNTLFEFKLSGETRTNEHGLTEVLGDFVQVGTMSERIQKMFFKAGINKSQIAEFLTKEQ